uniref:Uncharacterized protein n=1 Tax=Strongyloides papillosus TaxID=174720 RepID=A0A0N5BC91_STREA
MIFSNHIKLYILLFISLVELVKFTLPSDNETLPKKGSRKSKPKKKHSLSRRKSNDRNSNTRDLSPGQRRRSEKLDRQLSVNSSKIISDLYKTRDESNRKNSERKLSELVRKLSLSSSHRKSGGSKRRSNPNIGYLSLPKPIRRLSPPCRRGRSPRYWNCIG